MKCWGALHCNTYPFPSLKLYGDIVTIGRANPFLNLTDKHLSRTHCELRKKNVGTSTLVVVVAKTENGTFINRNEIFPGEETILRPFDELELLDPIQLKDHCISYCFLGDGFNKELQNASYPLVNYTLSSFCGVGSFATVRKVIEKNTEKVWAMKVIHRNDSLPKNIERECKLLKELNHPNIINLQDLVFTKDFVFLIMEYVEGGDLFEYLFQSDFSGFKENDVSVIMRQLLNALNYLHQKNVIHRDIKLENVLFSLTSTGMFVKMTDFGLGRFVDCDSKASTICGSKAYTSPDVLLGNNYDGIKNDIWGCGVLMYMLLCQNYPFGDDDDQNTTSNILSAHFNKNTLFDNASNSFKDLIHHMLDVNQVTRYTAQQCIDHEFITRTHSINVNDNNHSIPKPF
ncbi:hypothetical protein QTN25_007405 [Entamoeba marina]